MKIEDLYYTRIRQALIKEYDNNVKEYSITKAKLYLLENQDLIINNVIRDLRINTNLINKNDEILDIIDKIDNNKQQLSEYIKNKSNEDIFNDIRNIYLNEYQNYFKTYKIKESAEKDYYKQLIYDNLIKDIEKAKNYSNIDNIITNIKTSEFKQAFLQDLKKEYNDINITIFNDLYMNILNKAISEYKQDRENYKLINKNVYVSSKRTNKSKKIPMGWKLYAGLKVAHKFLK